MDKVNIAVVGLGGIAQIMHLPLIQKNKEAVLTAICDIDSSKAKYIAKKYNLPKGYKNLDTMFDENPEIDAVIIASGTFAHLENALTSLKAGKHILVEKPIALNSSEAKKINDAASDSGKLVMVGMNNRFRNDSMLQRNFIKGKELGEIFYVKAGWLKSQSSDEKWFTNQDEAGGGVFMDNGIALLDMGLWMLDFPEVHSVSAVNYYHNTKKVEDSNFTFIKFNNGASLTIEVSWSFIRSREFFYCNVFGKNGSTSINPLRIFKLVNKQLFNITPKNIRMKDEIYKQSYENQLRYFIGAIQGNHPLISSGKEAYKVMDIIDAIYKSAKQNKEIIFK